MLYRSALALLFLGLAACDSGTEEPAAPVLSECEVSEDMIEPGNEITFDATLNADAQVPLLISIDWGDGDTDDVTSFPIVHTYDAAGSYTPRARALNSLGSDSCQQSVEVSNPLCQNLDFGRINFGFQSSVLSAESLSLLDQNAFAVRSCSNVCLTIQGYTDDLETDQAALSQARADAVQDYYVSQGVAQTRSVAQGLGQAPDSNSNDTPGQGDLRARRVESIPGTCPQ